MLPAAFARLSVSVSRPVLPVLALALSACGAAGAGDEPLVLGVAAPLHAGEAADVYGENTRLGAELALKEINAAGGIDGRPLALEVRDDKGDPQEAIRVAEALGTDPRILAVVGHVYSGTMVEAGPIYQKYELPAVATTATSSEISSLGPWIFRVGSSDSANAVEMAQVAQRLGRPTAVLYANEEYGRGLNRHFHRAFTASGNTLLGMDPYLEEMEDFRPFLARLRQRGVRLVFLAGIDQGASRIIPQAREVGLDARFMGGDGIEALAGMGAGFDGTMVGTLFHPDASPESQAFTRAYRAAYRREPDSAAALAYDAVKLLARALAAGNHDRASIRRYLEGVGREGGSPEYRGVAGPIHFDEHGDPVKKSFTVGVIQAGAIRLPGRGS